MKQLKILIGKGVIILFIIYIPLTTLADVTMTKIMDPRTIEPAMVPIIPKVQVFNESETPNNCRVECIITNPTGNPIYSTIQETQLEPNRRKAISFPIWYTPEEVGIYTITVTLLESKNEQQLKGTVLIDNSYISRYITREGRGFWFWRKYRTVYNYVLVRFPTRRFDVFMLECLYDYTWSNIEYLTGPYNGINQYQGWHRGMYGEWGAWESNDPRVYYLSPYDYGYFYAKNRWNNTTYEDPQLWSLNHYYWGWFYGTGSDQENVDIGTSDFEDSGGFSPLYPPAFSTDDNLETYSQASDEENTNWITYDLGQRYPITHVAIYSILSENYYNPCEVLIAISTDTLDSGNINEEIVLLKYPQLHEGEYCELPLFPEDTSECAFTRYIQIKIKSQWIGGPLQVPYITKPEDVRIAECTFYSYPFTCDNNIDFNSIKDMQNKRSTKDRCDYSFTITDNPIVSKTAKITYTLPNDGNVRLEFIDTQGRLAQTFINEYKQAGFHSLMFSISDYPIGLYFLKMSFNGRELLKKITVLK